MYTVPYGQYRYFCVYLFHVWLIVVIIHVIRLCEVYFSILPFLFTVKPQSWVSVIEHDLSTSMLLLLLYYILIRSARGASNIDPRAERFNPLSPHDALKHHLTSLKSNLIFL